MAERHWKITTLATAVSLLLAVGGMILYTGKLIERSDVNSGNITDLQVKIQTVPTRNEFDMLKGSVDRIDRNVQALVGMLQKR